jgi:arginine decarboxylase
MQIHVSSGRGEGPTPLAAFDAALRDAGVSNYNLIALSSVIPP